MSPREDSGGIAVLPLLLRKDWGSPGLEPPAPLKRSLVLNAELGFQEEG